MSEKVCVVTAYVWRLHYETDLELIQQHLKQGDEVYHVRCHAERPSCWINRTHQLDKCFSCRSIVRESMKAIDGAAQIRVLPLIDSAIKGLGQRMDVDVQSINKLKALQYKGFPIGYAVASTLISQYRDHELPVENHLDEVRRYISEAVSVYDSMAAYLQRFGFDRVYVFNGRFHIARAVLSACLDAGVDCYLHDRGGPASHFNLWQNHLPHDIDQRQLAMDDVWQASDLSVEERTRIGKDFFRKRRERVPQVGGGHVELQERGLLPNFWDESQRNIVLFSSSEDEFAAIGTEWENPLYASQEHGVRRIVEDLRDCEEVVVHLRVHPNAAKSNSEWVERIRAIASEKFRIIDASSAIDTYSLIDAADIVVTFGSTVGIEAAYYGKPSVLLGRSFYQYLACCYIPTDHDSAVTLLKKDRLDPLDPSRAVQYGYFLESYGRPFKHFDVSQEDAMKGVFNGVNVFDFRQFPMWRHLVKDFLKLPIIRSAFVPVGSFFHRRWLEYRRGSRRVRFRSGGGDGCE